MTPTDIDSIASSILTATGAAWVEITIVMPDESSLTHTAGTYPETHVTDWGDVLEKLKKWKGDKANEAG